MGTRDEKIYLVVPANIQSKIRITRSLYHIAQYKKDNREADLTEKFLPDCFAAEQKQTINPPQILPLREKY